jgi:ABC-type uncharacterized transport system YnjBCD permease subunit
MGLFDVTPSLAVVSLAMLWVDGAAPDGTSSLVWGWWDRSHLDQQVKSSCGEHIDNKNTIT